MASHSYEGEGGNHYMDGHLTGNFLAILLSVHIDNSWFCHNTPPEVRILPNYTLLTRRFFTFSQFLKTPPPISFSLSLSLLSRHCYLRRKSYSLLLLLLLFVFSKIRTCGVHIPSNHHSKQLLICIIIIIIIMPSLLFNVRKGASALMMRSDRIGIGIGFRYCFIIII